MSGGTLTGITELQGFNNSKLVVGKPVIVEDFNWGGVFLYKSGELPSGVIGINSGINPGYHWVDLIGNFVVSYANANLAEREHTHDSAEITDLTAWATAWLPSQSIDAEQITGLVFPAAPVDSVNGQTGIVNLTAADVGAIALGSITITTAEITDWATGFAAEFATNLADANVDFSQITNIPLEAPVNWDDIDSKPTFLLDFEALSISFLQGFLYHSGPDIWELRTSLAIADITNLQSTLDGKQASHSSLSALSTIGDNANTGYFKKTGLNSWQVASSVAWGELSSIPTNLGGIGSATLTGDGLLRRDGGNWAIAPQIDWGELGNIPANLGEVAAIATAGYLKRAIDGSIEAVEEVVKPPRPGTWGDVNGIEVGDVPIIIVPEDLVTNQRYVSFVVPDDYDVNIYCKIGGPPDLVSSPPTYSFILRPGKQIINDDFFHNGQAIWAATPASTQLVQIQIAPAAIDYTGTEDLSAYQLISGKGEINGYAPLGPDAKVPQIHLPAIAITDTYPVASEAAMLALVAETGDVAVRTDISQSFILQGTDPSLLTDWQELLSPGNVTSVNGQDGTVVINDIAGNAGTATSLETARNISLDGDITGSVSFDGSSDVVLTSAIAPGVVTNTNLADMSAGTIKGAEILGSPVDLSSTQVLGILGVEPGATANSADAFLLNRANHTGTQIAASISDFEATVSANPAVVANTAKVTNATHTGDVTGDSALTISPGIVTDSKLADVSESTIKGRISAGTGSPENLTATQVRGLLNVADGATANSTDAALRDRSTHTGTQPGTTVTFNNTASGLVAVEVQGAINELDGRLDGLVIGTDVQGFSAELEAIASLASSENTFPYFTGVGTANLASISFLGMSLISNETPSGMRSEINAVGSDTTGIAGASLITNFIAISQQDYDLLAPEDKPVTTSFQITNPDPLAVTDGGTGANNAADARTNLGIVQGNFTPTILGTTTIGSGTYTNQDGSYFKIGNQVFIQIYLQWTAHTGTGQMRVGNLPFTNGTIHAAITIGLIDITLPTNSTLTGYVGPSSNEIILASLSTAGGSVSSIPLDIDTAGQLNLSLIYVV